MRTNECSFPVIRARYHIAYCWSEYKTDHPDGYEQSQFYEYYNRFVESHYGKRDTKKAVERVPGEKMYIDWVGDQPFLFWQPFHLLSL